jgi:beta-1,4-N-acetylglucosaminyltransferase
MLTSPSLGTGTILEAIRISVPIVVVPNPSLQDNHQEELAQELQGAGYVAACHLEYVPILLGRSDDCSIDILSGT